MKNTDKIEEGDCHEEIYCPYCNVIYEMSYEIHTKDEDWIETCQSCDKEFDVERRIDVYYRSHKKQ